jgi:uncharacterized membrane protein YtjA (UPF0391 family)
MGFGRYVVWRTDDATLSNYRAVLLALHCQECPNLGILMLHYAAVFFVIALVAALFGFGGIAAGAVGIAKTLFFVFLILAVLSFLFGQFKRN